MKGNLRIWISTTNLFKTGGRDDYTLLGTLPVSAQKGSFHLDKPVSGFYKIVLEGDYNSSNYWIETK